MLVPVRGILDPMLKRLCALVVALAVVGAPLVLEICQVTCETTGMQPSMPHGAEANPAHHHMPADHAACHEHSGTPLQLFPVNGLCEHGTDSMPTLAGRDSDTAASLLAAVPSIDFITGVPTRDVISVRDSAWPDRPAVLRAVPLRV
jgi:hypothetical protein